MARRPRIEIAGYYHIIKNRNRGIEGSGDNDNSILTPKLKQAKINHVNKSKSLTS